LRRKTALDSSSLEKLFSPRVVVISQAFQRARGGSKSDLLNLAKLDGTSRFLTNPACSAIKLWLWRKLSFSEELHFRFLILRLTDLQNDFQAPKAFPIYGRLKIDDASVLERRRGGGVGVDVGAYVDDLAAA